MSREFVPKVPRLLLTVAWANEAAQSEGRKF
jgi:hypothetical protein